MPSSNRGFSGRGNGTITVIEEPVLRSYRRKAKVVFYVTWVITAVLAATVAASRWHPIIALLAGIICGYVLGAAAGGIVAAWPVIRAIWWWAPETLLTGSLVFGWVELADHTTLIIRLAATAAIVGIPAAIGPVRSCIGAAAWCLVTRHRIRTCFSEFIITNRTGSLPLILWARPSRVGERVFGSAAPRPGPGRHPGPAGQDRRGLLGVRRPGRGGLPVELRLRPDRHQAPRRADRHHRLPSAGPDQVRHPRPERDTDQTSRTPSTCPTSPLPTSPPPGARPAARSSGPATPGRPPRRHPPPRLPRRQRHHRLDSDPARYRRRIPPPGRQLPRAARLAPTTHAEEPTPRPCRPGVPRLRLRGEPP